MDPARWTRTQEIFHQARELPAAGQRDFVSAACDGDDSLLILVLHLLEEDANTGSVLDLEVAQVAGMVLGDPADAASPMARVGRYAIGERIGEGGMGVVYLAQRDDLGSRVAIKILRDAWVSPARRERFASEQRTLARLNHPSIARIYDADTLEDATPWFAMEYVDGVPITDHCTRAEATIDDRLRLFRQVCEAVQHAHQQLVVHRDLKPSNILVTPEGAVKLLDFGIAKQLETLEGGAEYTRTALRLMTPAYAAPEQVRGEPCGVQTDVYALGVILYELLAGRRPFDLSNRTPVEAEHVVLTQEPERPSATSRSGTRLPARAGAWADLDVLCLTAMHKDPRRRYANVEALIRDLDNYQSGRPLDARPDSLAYRAEKFARRNWQVLAAASAIVAVVVGLVAFYTARLTTAYDAALAEAARTQRIQRFMLNLFEGGESSVGPAADLRVVALLERGVREAQSLDAVPALQAELYQTLGNIYQRLGNYDQADGLLGSALEQRRALLGAGHPDVLESQVDLGLLRVDQAQLEEAERLILEGLEVGRRALPDGHPALAKATAALGRVRRERGAYDEATRHLDEAVRLYSAMPSSAPELAATLTALANTHFYAGRLDVSEQLNLRVIEMDRQLYGNRHPNVAHDLLNLGTIESSRGQHVEAGARYREALQILESWYGRDHPETASAMTILGQSYVQEQRYDEATQLLRDALPVQERTYGAVHPRVAFVLNAIGLVALQRDRLTDAESALARALEIYTSVYGGKHARVGVAMANLASVHLAAAEYARAETLFQQALALYAELLPANHLNIAIARSKLGRTLVRQGRYGEAEELLVGAHDVLTRQNNPSSTWLRTTREDLASVYESLAKPEQAAAYRAALSGAEAARRQ